MIRRDFNAALFGILFRPRRTAAEVAKRDRLLEGAAVYAASMAAAMAFYTHLPEDLPAAFYEYFPFLTKGAQPAGFWAGAAGWGTALFLAETGAMRLLLRLMGSRVTFLALLGLFCWVHVYYLLMFVAMTGAVWARNAQAAYVAEIGFTLWSLYAAVTGLREVAGVSVPKSFAAVILSSLAALMLLFGAHAAGLIGQEQLKALVMF